MNLELTSQQLTILVRLIETSTFGGQILEEATDLKKKVQELQKKQAEKKEGE